MSLTRSSQLWILIWRKSGMSILLLIPRWSGQLNHRIANFKNLFAKKSNRWPELSSLCLWGQANFKENCYCFPWVDKWFWWWSWKHCQQQGHGGWQWSGWGGQWWWVRWPVESTPPPPNCSGSLLQSFDSSDSAGENNDKWGNNSSFLSIDDDERQG